MMYKPGAIAENVALIIRDQMLLCKACAVPANTLAQSTNTHFHIACLQA